MRRRRSPTPGQSLRPRAATPPAHHSPRETPPTQPTGAPQPHTQRQTPTSEQHGRPRPGRGTAPSVPRSAIIAAQHQPRHPYEPPDRRRPRAVSSSAVLTDAPGLIAAVCDRGRRGRPPCDGRPRAQRQTACAASCCHGSHTTSSAENQSGTCRRRRRPTILALMQRLSRRSPLPHRGEGDRRALDERRCIWTARQRAARAAPHSA